MDASARGLAALAALAVTALCTSCGPAESGSRREVTTPALTGPTVAGDGARYTYDDAGNLVRIGSSSAAAAVEVLDFSPRRGGPGELVTVIGSGFSPDPSDNGVLLGGTNVTVLSATATELLFAIPAGATTGRISVTRGGATGTSAQDFTVVAGVVIAGFTPRLGRAGTILTITGNNFGPSPDADQVFVGAGAATIESASLTAITAAVGSTATSGRVTVSSPAGTATSADDFFLVPGSLTEWDVEFTAQAGLGEATEVAIAQPGQAGLVLFDGTEGSFLTLYTSGVTFPHETRVTVYAPGGSAIYTKALRVPEDKLELPRLPASGPYTILVQPGASAAGSLTLQILPEVTAALQPGIAAPLTLARGQNGRLTFTGNAGDHLSIAWPSFAATQPMATASIEVRQPDGALISTGDVFAPGSRSLPVLTQTGTYTVTLRPSLTVGATLVFYLSAPDVGIALLDGPEVQFQNAVPGQAGRYAFLGRAGEVVGLGVSALSTTPANGSVTFTIEKPGGVVLSSWGTNGPKSWRLPLLPVDGSYTVMLQPGGTATASVSFLLSRAVTGALATDGTPTVFETARVGQPARFTFPGSQGQRFTLQGTGSSLGSGALRTMFVGVDRPDGTSLPGSMVLSGPATDTKLDLGALPVTGTYTARIDPDKLTTGRVALRLVAEASDVLVVDDPPKALALGTAQSGRYTFSGSTGERLGLGISSFASTPPGGGSGFVIFKPDGSVLTSPSVSYPTSTQLTPLPATGTYTITVTPTTTAALAFTVLLSHPLGGPLATDGTPTVWETTRVGQQGRYTFTGTAGQRFTLWAAGGALSRTVYLSVYQPSGTTTTPTPVTSGQDAVLDLGALSASGTYTVTLDPNGVATGLVALRLVPAVTQAFAIGDPVKTFDLAPAQNARFTFDASAGDRLGLALTARSTTPAAASVRLSVTSPAGTVLWSNTPPSATSFQLPVLPATGTYALDVVQTGASSGAFGLMLSRELTGTLPPDGSVVSYQTARPGQAGRYTFAGTAGQRFTLWAAPGAGFGPYQASLTVSSPTGSSIGYTQFSTFSAGKLDLGVLASTGIHTVYLQPVGLATGSIDVQLLPYAADTLAVGDPPRTIALGTAQHGAYTFTGSAGATLNLVVAGFATAPPGGSAGFDLRKPDGTSLWSATVYGGTSTLVLPQLPATGTYTLLVRPQPIVGASGSFQLVTR